jgi:hypothetical protein
MLIRRIGETVYYDGCSCDLCRKANADRALEYLHRMHPDMGHHARPWASGAAGG